MNLLNQQVKHEHFGDGTVVDCTVSHVSVLRWERSGSLFPMRLDVLEPD